MGVFSLKVLNRIAASALISGCTIFGAGFVSTPAANGQLFGGFQRTAPQTTQTPSSYSQPRQVVRHSGYYQPHSPSTSKKPVDTSITAVRTVQAATNSWNAQREVRNSIPWAKLNQKAKSKIQSVVQSPSIYRRLPVNQIHCDPQFFTFALRNPDTVVNMWKVFGVSQMTLQKKAPYQFTGHDGSGTNCTAELVYGDSNIHVYYGTGVYQGPVFKRRITGRCVAVVRTGYQKGKSQYVLENKMDIFLKVDNVAADLVARTLQPMVGKSTDHNFRESLAFLQAFSATAVTEPHRTSYLIAKMPGVANDTKSQFHKIVASIPKRQSEYQAAISGKPASSRTAVPVQKVPIQAINPKKKPQFQGRTSASIDSPAVYRSIR